MAKIELRDVNVSYFMRKTAATAKRFERDAVGAQIIVGQRYIEIAALKNLTLSFKDGDRVGLIGTNGSGKSTLLKLCAGGLSAQRGAVDIEGVVSPQFALSTGLRPELSGRQNTELKCLYMGIPQLQILSHTDDVHRISGLGGYFDLPIKSYSAGMKSRLVMSLLRLVRGEILIMDEWINAVDPSLSKTIGGLQSQLIDRSKILMLASHSERVLREWVQTLVWLEQGEIREIGTVDSVLRSYNALLKG
ncbi:MAG: ABC transporter ATP-binding protein [Aliihoeflea sp.]|uniref:ABC transporter ATP-binding protein n=1 Tax=Aliihoeflea sp. TaxID=2608088 RepID=UPI004033E2F3